MKYMSLIKRKADNKPMYELGLFKSITAARAHIYEMCKSATNDEEAIRKHIDSFAIELIKVNE